MRPDPAAEGTLVAILVLAEEEGEVRVMFNPTFSFEVFDSKFVPVIVTGVPGVPTVGVNPLMVGRPGATVDTVNEPALVAEPAGEVTAIVPVVAPAGTLVTIRFVLDETTVAETPLNAQCSGPRSR